MGMISKSVTSFQRLVHAPNAAKLTCKQRVPVESTQLAEDASGSMRPFFAEALCYTGGVARLESLNNHEEHGRDHTLV